MTTDPSPLPEVVEARQARLEALRQRRTASQADGAPLPRTRRRRHPATGARILAASLSASAAMGLMAVMAGTPADTSVAPPNTASVAEPVVIVIRSSTDATATTASATVANAPAVAASTATPVTTSQAS